MSILMIISYKKSCQKVTNQHVLNEHTDFLGNGFRVATFVWTDVRAEGPTQIIEKVFFYFPPQLICLTTPPTIQNCTKVIVKWTRPSWEVNWISWLMKKGRCRSCNWQKYSGCIFVKIVCLDVNSTVICYTS